MSKITPSPSSRMSLVGGGRLLGKDENYVEVGEVGGCGCSDEDAEGCEEVVEDVK